MGFGQIPGANVRACWRLENTSDDGDNGFTLTNNNSVAFSVGKYTNGADNGSSGNNKALSLGSNPLSVVVPTTVVVQFWFKLNDITTSNLNAVLFAINSKTSATDGMTLSARYNISAGNINLDAQASYSGGTITVSTSYVADTVMHFVQIVKTGTTVSLLVDRDFNKSSAGTGSGTETSLTTFPTVFFVIGNNRGFSGGSWCVIDEFVIDEILYTAREERMKYYTQAIGRFCI